MNTKKIEKLAVTPREAARLFGLSEGTLANLRCKKLGPMYYRVPGGRKIVYFLSDIEDWIRKNPVATLDSLDR